MPNCDLFKDRFIECMFDKSELVQQGSSIGEAMRSGEERNFPLSCYEIYRYYRICLNELAVNSRARLRNSPLDRVTFDEDGNLVHLDTTK